MENQENNLKVKQIAEGVTEVTEVPKVQISKEEVESPPLVVDLGHDKLLEALFFFWDGFERSSIDFFLIGDTCKQVKADKELSGDKLTLGVRRLEWDSGQGRVFEAFMEHEKQTPLKKDDLLIYDFKGVPVFVYLYEDNPCLTGLDIVFYANETFNTPNPYNTFAEKYERV